MQQVRLHMLMVLPSRSLCCCEGRKNPEGDSGDLRHNEGRRTKPEKIEEKKRELCQCMFIK